MRRIVGPAMGVLLLSSVTVTAQDRDQTLADIRQELSVLYVELQSLKREQSTTGAPQISLPPNALDRLNTLEQELSRLTAKTEQLEFRIDRIVRDGTNRIGDLEFRLVELEGGDLSQLGETTTLGGEDVPRPAPPVPGPGPETPQLAVAEQADFDAAQALLDNGDAAGAAEAFAAYTQTYPGSPLVAEAHYLRGQAEAAQGQWSRAARAYLESFSGSPDGPRAPEALYRLGLSLAELGQRDEACITLREVSVRFPGGAPSIGANTARGELACP
ncbi:Tol-Pal system YbgF [Dinoroseobacter shibae DFL 12 = DSM 16493]|uniref:Cell division coordinator CpoB n=2 Tax=Pseudomonadota TaxID=1224 RepID=A8LHQ8_DINSH|nr:MULTISPECIES: tol-pal system protein YbgF [Dinoroseobacter]ABV92855.1 Tol-Pal system YbgF [Dinoroseobacter shibae DFL 12 = DSM 16493]MDD9715955.1 tol-pal system protein YbgF [Dinoroseobacter sp. PD6]URF48521.1 tol-pal system protein YbgF [Dinoroseobacter shibae]URF52835.1 tol-pal system protein YbgF [Dinoroseobacter shibae]